MLILYLEIFETEDPYGNVHTENVAPSFFEFAFLRKMDIWIYYFYSVVVVYNVRSHLRSRYAIPEMPICIPDNEDIILSCCCPHITAAQMLRHTADYDVYAGQLCTATGV